MRVISARTSRSTRVTSALEGFSCAASTSSCPLITVSGVRSSWDASATNSRWLANASDKRSSMRLNASARTRTSSRRSVEISIRGPRSPASTARLRRRSRAFARLRRCGARPDKAASLPAVRSTLRRRYDRSRTTHVQSIGPLRARRRSVPQAPAALPRRNVGPEDSRRRRLVGAAD